MGGCCSSSEDDVEVVELNNVTNAAVQCQGGKCGSNIKMSRSEGGDFKVSGSGVMLGSCCLDCDIAYWEIKVLKGGASVNIGLKKFHAKRPVSLEGTLKSENDGKGNEPEWVLLREYLPKDCPELKEGDVIGVHWDQTDFPMVCFTLNGVFLPNASITRIRPAQDIYPAISVVGDGQVLTRFSGDNFEHKPIASKFVPIVCATNLI
jgi:hypothetical protein